MYAKQNQKILLFALSILMILFYSHTASADWTTVTLDSGDIGWYTSLDLDANGNPRISYHESTLGDLKYTWCDADCGNTSNWTNITVDGIGGDDVGRHSSLVLDSSDNPRISYYDETIVDDGNLKYVSCDTGCDDPVNWTKGIVDSTDDVGWDSSLALALNSSDAPRVSYRDKTTKVLKYASCDTGCENQVNWTTEIVDNIPNVGEYTSLALDSGGNPHISYYHRTFGDLRYAYHNGTSWLITTVDGSACTVSGNTCHDDSDCPGETCWRPTSDVGEYTSLALDSSNRPRISYYNGSDNHLEYASCDTGCENPGNWTTETVDDSGNVGIDNSLALDNSGTPHISYYNWGNALKYATYDDLLGWQTEIVDNVGDVGEFTSIAVDNSGNPHISYHDWDNDYLKYATFADPCLVDADCNDNNDCTDDTCNVPTGDCVFTPNDSNVCSDGLFCTLTDVCSGGACLGSGDTCDVSQVCDEGTDMCYDDADADGVFDNEDNCIDTPNPGQEDTSPPLGNGIGDACDCEGDFNCDGNVDATDVTSFLNDFGRNTFNNACSNAISCNGDFNCDTNVDATDVTKFLEDFGRNQYNNSCPACVAGDWCVYP